ncbi:MAG: FHA domain-containing protein [Paraglaciecola sp.]|uniref:FHA domain-containing protein n=1 Tax=Paraglaciecola sp. TaxID=1920173 RepID=UPI0032971697
MAIVLELLSRKNIPLKHFKFEQDYVNVGRDFNNDLRLDDPYVCPSHMLVAMDPESGLLMVNDCKSANGIKVNNKFVTQAKLNPQDIIKVGRTRLRIIDTKAPLAEAIPLSELEENLSWLNRAPLAVALSFMCLGLMLALQFFSSVNEFNILKALPTELGQLAAYCLWPLCFAVLAKVVKKESHLTNQVNLMLMMFLFVNLLLLSKNVVIFNIHPGAWFAWFELLLLAGLTAGFIWLTLFIGFHQTNRRRNIISFLMTTTIIAPIYVLGFLNSGDFNPRPIYDPILLPPTYNLTGSIDTQEFVEKTENLFIEVDNLKTK